MKKPLVVFGIAFGVAAVVAAATIIAVCGTLFGCGCTLRDGDSFCNIRDAQGPYCPWCDHGAAGFYIPFALILAGVAGSIALVQARTRSEPVSALLAGLGAYLLWSLLVGLLSALWWGYPYFLVWSF